METPSEESEFEKRAKLIGQILDELMPITDDMSQDVAEATDVERQMFVLRTGMNNRSLEELEYAVLERTFELPPIAE